jgi:hypothetical protein
MIFIYLKPIILPECAFVLFCIRFNYKKEKTQILHLFKHIKAPFLHADTLDQSFRSRIAFFMNLSGTQVSYTHSEISKVRQESSLF